MWRLAAAVALSGILWGCQGLSFYGQALRGQWEIVARSRPLEAVIEDPRTPPDRRRRLATVRAITTFADDTLLLASDGSYRRFADLQRPYVVWNVFAAPEFSLTPKTWWYPLVGRLSYQGWFSEAGARRVADRLAGNGYDVYVAGVPAYSTLGWFADPVLNTFVDYPETDLAALLFHELAHRRLYIPGDTTFNESFAVAVETEGVRLWLAERGQAAQFEAYLKRQAFHNAFVKRVLACRDRLAALYAQAGLSGADRRRAKAAAFERLHSDYRHLKAQWNGYSGYDPWFSRPLNNARLLTVSTYHGHVAAFRSLFRSVDGDWRRFYAACRDLADAPAQERSARLKELKVQR